MSYRPMGQSGGGGAGVPEKTQGWLWGFLCCAIVGAAVTAYYMWS
jgi:uncharacterized iron-regulated membrane protein